MSETPIHQPPVLDYGDGKLSGPTPFDRFMGTLLYVISGACVLGVIVVLVVAWRHHLNRAIVLFGSVGIVLVLGMAFVLFCAGRAIWTSERRQG